MATETFNKGVDYFGLVAASNPVLAVKSSSEKRTKQSASGANTFGDIKVVDSYGETSDPSAEYDVIADMTENNLTPLGTCATPTGLSKPVVLGSITINTSSGANPTLSASGSEVQSGATTLRTYELPHISVSKRHRAQDFLCTVSGSTYTPIMSIMKGATAASPVDDYGLESVTATFPIEITRATPKGVTVNYDLHGGTPSANYTLNWYADTAPTIALTSAATTAGYTMSAPVTKDDPEGGYTQYTWSVTFPMLGEEASNNG